MINLARITEIVEPEVAAFGFALVRVSIFDSSEVGGDEKTLQIMAEDPATGQLVLNQCAELSHRISSRFDALEEQGEAIIDEAYRLEVSSPGIDRPLTRLGDFVRWAGHEAKIRLSAPVSGNRTTLHGDLAGVEGENILFKDRKSGEVTFPFAHVESARLVLTDRLLAATRPLDMTGADEEQFIDNDTGTDADVPNEQED